MVRLSMNKILIDNRWEGTGGIGTFAYETNKINGYENAGFSGAPFSPLDSFKLTLKTIFTRNKVIFFPGYIPPLFSNSPYVITIHDLNHLDREENSSVIKKLFYNTIILRGCRKAEYVFTVSDFSRKRILEWSNLPEGKVINVGNGVSTEFSSEGEGFGYSFEYFLCVSNRKSHKNEIRTLVAFKKSKIPREIKLVFTGKINSMLNTKIVELGLSERVVFTGFLDKSDLPKVYRGAKALVFVSLYEGFGLPVLEAMASGVPVITSMTTSLGEIAGDAAYLVDPENVDQIAEAITVINHDEFLRTNLICKGLLHTHNYSWEKTASKINYYLSLI